MTTSVIDTHAHIVPPEMYKQLRRNPDQFDVTFSGDEQHPLVQLAAI